MKKVLLLIIITILITALSMFLFNGQENESIVEEVSLNTEVQSDTDSNETALRHNLLEQSEADNNNGLETTNESDLSMSEKMETPIVSEKEQLDKPEKQLTIYTYSSLGRELIQAIENFGNSSDIQIKIVPFDGSSDLILKTMNSAEADIILGIDNIRLGKIIEHDIIYKDIPDGIAKNIEEDLVKYLEYGFVPYDYGYPSINYNAKLVTDQSEVLSLEELVSTKLTDSIIMSDPRYSQVAIAFLLQIYENNKDNFEEYLNSFIPSVKVITKGWSGSNSLFVSGEAPYVLSYITSPAAYLYYLNNSNFKATVTDDDMFRLVEGAIILKSSKNKQAATEFLSFMVGDSFQSEIPLGNILFPVNNNIVLPEYFSTIPTVLGDIEITPEQAWEDYQVALDIWLTVYSAQ